MGLLAEVPPAPDDVPRTHVGSIGDVALDPVSSTSSMAAWPWCDMTRSYTVLIIYAYFLSPSVVPITYQGFGIQHPARATLEPLT